MPKPKASGRNNSSNKLPLLTSNSRRRSSEAVPLPHRSATSTANGSSHRRSNKPASSNSRRRCHNESPHSSRSRDEVVPLDSGSSRVVRWCSRNKAAKHVSSSLRLATNPPRHRTRCEVALQAFRGRNKGRHRACSSEPRHRVCSSEARRRVCSSEVRQACNKEAKRCSDKASLYRSSKASVPRSSKDSVPRSSSARHNTLLLPSCNNEALRSSVARRRCASNPRRRPSTVANLRISTNANRCSSNSSLLLPAATVGSPHTSTRPHSNCNSSNKWRPNTSSNVRRR